MKSIPHYIFVALGLLVLGFVLWYAQSLIVYIVISGILSLIGQPVVAFFKKIRIREWRLPNSLCAAITLIFIWFIIFLFFRLFIPMVLEEVDELSNINVQSIIKSIREPLQRIENFFGESNIHLDNDLTVEEYVANKMISFFDLSAITNWFGSFASTLGDIFIAIFSISFITFFFLKHDNLFGNAILAFIPAKYVKEASHAINSISRLLKRYFIGVGIEVILVIMLVSMGLYLIGFPIERALVTGLVVGIMNVIPYLGPIIGAVFGLMIGIATNISLNFYVDVLPLLGKMLLVFAIVQVIDNVLFQPLIYSNSVHAHPLEIFLVIMLAGNIAGIVGMILAIPAYTILRVVAKEFFTGIKVIKQLTQNIR